MTAALPPERQPRRGPGQPTKLTEHTQQTIVDAVRVGNYLKVAAQAAGVGASTLAAWLARGRQAAATVADHGTEDGRWCPSCDLDRTQAADAADAEQDRLDAEYEAARDAWRAEVAGLLDDAVRPEPPQHVGVVLDRCPRCGTHDPPTAWELDEVEARYLEFLEAVTAAEASAEVAAVVAIRSAFGKDWRSARDFLRARRPERWAATTRIQMTAEESERRIDDAVTEALVALGVDTSAAALDALGIDLDGIDDAPEDDDGEEDDDG